MTPGKVERRLRELLNELIGRGRNERSQFV